MNSRSNGLSRFNKLLSHPQQRRGKPHAELSVQSRRKDAYLGEAAGGNTTNPSVLASQQIKLDKANAFIASTRQRALDREGRYGTPAAESGKDQRTKSCAEGAR